MKKLLVILLALGLVGSIAQMQAEDDYSSKEEQCEDECSSTSNDCYIECIEYYS